MKEPKINSIYLTKERFGYSLYQTLAEQLKILMQAGEVCEVYDDDVGIIVIKHMHRDTSSEAWGEPNPMWLTPEEQDLIYSRREEDEPKRPEEEQND